MAATFPLGSTVKINAIAPEGPVTKIRFNDDGLIEYLVTWVDIDGVSQERWFLEDSLVAA
jgi:hypothetical protein